MTTENKLYRVTFYYALATIYAICWAKNADDVLKIMYWTKEDRPVINVKEITAREGCVLSVTVTKQL